MRKLATSVAAAVPVAVLLAAGLLAGCVGGLITGSGNVETREMDFTGFDRVEAGYAFEVEITQSDSYSVRITADDNLFDDCIAVSKQGRTLKIGLKPTVTVRPWTLKAEVTMPDLYGLGLSGAARGTVAGFSSSEGLDLDLSGAGSLEMSDMSAGDITLDLSGASRVSGDITASGDAEFDLGGASRVELAGLANDMRIVASGASKLELEDFPVRNADVSLNGASQATVNLDGRLDADLSGASKLWYVGEPTMGDMHMSGGSTLSKKG